MSDTPVTGSTDETDAAAASFTVVAGDPTPAELAAVTAVVSAVLEEIASDRASSGQRIVSAWERSQRAIRAPITRGIDAWRGFSA